MKHTALAVAILAGAGLAAYSPSFSGVFVFDDLAAIAQNPHVTRLWPITEAMRAPEQSTLAGRPVAALSFAVTHALAPSDARNVMRPGTPASPAGTAARFLRNVWWYHAVNLTIHLLVGFALFGVVRRTLAVRDLKKGGSDLVALAISLLWIVHPLTTGAVTYLVQRVESLMALFYLLTLYCAIRAGTASARDRRLWTAGALASCALGMGTKEVMVTAPIAVMVWDWVFGARRRPGFYLGLCATWLILAALVATAPRSLSVGWTIDGWTPWTYLITQAGVIAHYITLAFVPLSLVFDYGWTRTNSLADVAPYAIALLAALAVTAWGVVRRKAPAFPAAMFFLLLAPSSSLLPIASEVAAEHRMYLPLAALITLVVVAAVRVAARLGWPSARVAWAAMVVASVIATGEVVLTRARNRDYVTAERLWADTVQKRPQNARAHHNYALEQLDAGRFRDAEASFRQAIAINPKYNEAYVGLGLALCSDRRSDEGGAAFDQALALGGYAEAYRSAARSKLMALCAQRAAR